MQQTVPPASSSIPPAGGLDFGGDQAWMLTGCHQSVVRTVSDGELLLQVYLALPAKCPQFPDGGKRDACQVPWLSSVIMYVSNDEALTFTQVCHSMTKPASTVLLVPQRRAEEPVYR